MNTAIAEKLNGLYGTFLEKYTEPIKLDMSEAITEIPSDNFGAFPLSSPHSKRIKLEKTKNGGVVVRFAFSYQKATELSDNYLDGLRFISVIQNEMLLAISPWIDWTSKNKPEIYFSRPGKLGVYFIELNDYAAVEMRAYYEGTLEV